MRASEIESNLREVGAELVARGLIGEIVIVGGAYMTLVLRSRDATADVDAYLAPDHAAAIREAALKAAAGRPQDVADLRTLIAHLGVGSADEALAIIERHIPERLLTVRTRLLVEGLFEDES